MDNGNDNRREVLLSLRECAECPRDCLADRFSGDLGYCECGAGMPIASVCAHMGEEPVLSGRYGICNIFFGHCNLQCVYCQNYQISSNRSPWTTFETGLESLVGQIEGILDCGATAVGFVSPSHCIPQMRLIMKALGDRGRQPVYVFNSNGYDRSETILSLENQIDVYLPDLKYMDNKLAREYSDVTDYVEVAGGALREMYRQVGSEILLDENGLITRGLIIRHLILPGHVENSKEVLTFIARELSEDIHISLMAQYHPTPAVAGHPKLGRRLTRQEYDEVLATFEDLGFHRGWVQDLTSPANYLPDFDKDHPFED